MPLGPLEWELGGLALPVCEPGDEGLDDVSELLDDSDADGTGDGSPPGQQVLSPRGITISVELPATDFATHLAELRKVMAPLPDRRATRLLRWRRIGEVAKRIAVQPAVGRALSVPGDRQRIQYEGGVITLRLTAPDPIILSDELHSEPFAAGQTRTIHNAGSLTAVLPSAWSLSAPGAVVLENLDHGEYVRFPKGPVTVARRRAITAPGTYGLCYGPGGTLLPRWPLLRPGNNTIRASAPCTLSWRDTW